MKNKKDKSEVRHTLEFFTFCLLFSVYFFLYFWSCAPAIKPVLEEREVIPEKGFDLITKFDEKFYSQKITADIEREAKLIGDESLCNYVDELGKRIISRTRFRSLAEGYEWSFKIIDSMDINAFASLGGKVYISRSLIEATENESELAGILAFEMGHIIGRNVQQHLSKEVLIQGEILPGEMITGMKGLKSLYQVFESESDVFNYFANLRFYQDEVERADELALYSSYDAGFNPQGLINFIERIWKKERKKPSSLWARRNPWTQKREKYALNILNRFPPLRFPKDSSKYSDLKIKLKALTLPSIIIDEELSLPEYVVFHRVRVMGNLEWTDAGLDVVEGQEIYFQASGGISLQEGNPIAECGPDGYNRKTLQQPFPDKNIGALIGKVVRLVSVEIDEETGEEIRNEIVENFFIGSERKVRVGINGHLFLGVNENVVGDNAGEFIVKIHLSRTNNNGSSPI